MKLNPQKLNKSYGNSSPKFCETLERHLWNHTFKSAQPTLSTIDVSWNVPDWPQLPPLPIETEEEAVADQVKETPGKNRNPSGPRAKDPYENDDPSAMLPIFVAIGAFIPLVFCMCKLWRTKVFFREFEKAFFRCVKTSQFFIINHTWSSHHLKKRHQFNSSLREEFQCKITPSVFLCSNKCLTWCGQITKIILTLVTQS